MTNETTATRNEAWGFFGTMASAGHDAAAAWNVAVPMIADATGCDEFEVRDFLDSRHGRHFADDVAGAMAGGRELGRAIEAAIDRWMSWTIGRRTSRETGIPAGLPYLTGYVVDAHLHAEAA